MIQKVAEVEYHGMLPCALLRWARYGLIERMVYLRMLNCCDGDFLLLYLPLGSIKSCYTLGICRLGPAMVVDPVLALVTIKRLTEVD